MTRIAWLICNSPTRLDGLNGSGQATNDAVQGSHALVNQVRWEKPVAALVTAATFPGFTPRDLQVLRKFLAETTSAAFFDVCTGGIQTTYLLFDEFPTPIILSQNPGVIPELIE